MIQTLKFIFKQEQQKFNVEQLIQQQQYQQNAALYNVIVETSEISNNIDEKTENIVAVMAALNSSTGLSIII